MSLSLFQKFPQFFNGILQLEGVVTVILHDPLVEVEVHLSQLGLVELGQLGAAQAVLLGQGRLLGLQEPAGGTERPEQSVSNILFSEVGFRIDF